MARIIDPDQLNLDVEVSFDTTSRIIELHVDTGNLTQEGVTLQALYSACKEFWQEDDGLIKLPFPFEAITEVKFDLFNGWDFAEDELKDDGDRTRDLIREGGWSKIDDDGNPQEQYFGFVTLGEFHDPAVDIAYYQRQDGGTVDYTVYPGPVNEPVKIFGDMEHGELDYRSYFMTFLREQGKTYGVASLDEQGVTNIDYTVYRLPLTNAFDPVIDATDNEIETELPYTNMSISYITGQLFETWVSGDSYVEDDVVLDSSNDRWYRATAATSGTTNPSDSADWEPYIGERQIGDDYYPFNVIIDGQDAVAERIYEFTQHANRQETDINDDEFTDAYGEVIGQTAPQLLEFLGETLITGEGVFIDDFNSGDTNRIEFNDSTEETRTFPFVAAGNINFNDNLQNDPNAKYWMFFEDDYGTDDAIIVNDADGSPITGDVSGNASVSFDFDYDNNTQGGRTAGTDANVIVVGIGLNTAQFVSVDGTISRNVGLVFTLVSALERNYISGS